MQDEFDKVASRLLQPQDHDEELLEPVGKLEKVEELELGEHAPVRVVDPEGARVVPPDRELSHHPLSYGERRGEMGGVQMKRHDASGLHNPLGHHHRHHQHNLHRSCCHDGRKVSRLPLYPWADTFESRNLGARAQVTRRRPSRTHQTPYRRAAPVHEGIPLFSEPLDLCGATDSTLDGEGSDDVVDGELAYEAEYDDVKGEEGEVVVTLAVPLLAIVLRF